MKVARAVNAALKRLINFRVCYKRQNNSFKFHHFIVLFPISFCCYFKKMILIFITLSSKKYVNKVPIDSNQIFIVFELALKSLLQPVISFMTEFKALYEYLSHC